MIVLIVLLNIKKAVCAYVYNAEKTFIIELI